MDFKASVEKMDDFLSDIHLKKKKKSGLKTALKIIRVVFGIVLFCLVVILIVSSVIFFRFKSVYDSAVLGKASLEYSLSNARRGDFAEMILAASRAEGYFNDILKEIGAVSDNFLISFSKFTQEQVADLEYLARSASIISRSLAQAGEMAGEINNIYSGQAGENFSKFSEAEKRKLLKMIHESGPELNGIKANLELALMYLDRIEASALFLPAKDKIDEAKYKLKEGVETLSNLVILSQLAPEIFGYPTNSHFLVLFQNNSELRPTGGFLGTYGILETGSGDIIRFDTHDIYHMDMPMEAGKLLAIEPPLPIKKYLNKNWYMRDANWSPDWPTAARRIDWFYHEENKRLPEKNQINDFSGKFSAVIAITPELVEDLLSLVGPLDISGEIYSVDNFSDLLQYKVEQDFLNQNVSAWERKEVIGSILEELKIKILDLHYNRWPELAELAEKNIAEKNVLVYFKDKNLEELIKDLGAGGEIKDQAGDYLMVVDSNMAALKTDAVMERSIRYSLEEKKDKLIAKLSLNYKNNGAYDWRTGDYHTYTRIYVPKDSRLIKAEGISKGEVEIGSESGKDYFAGFLSVRVGREAELYFEYELPSRLKDDLKNGKYSLYLQKQPGKNVRETIVDFKAISEVKSYNPEDKLEVVDENHITGSVDVSTDNQIEINFSRR